MKKIILKLKELQILKPKDEQNQLIKNKRIYYIKKNIITEKEQFKRIKKGGSIYEN